jgi:hypothetical protein
MPRLKSMVANGLVYVLGAIGAVVLIGGITYWFAWLEKKPTWGTIVSICGWLVLVGIGLSIRYAVILDKRTSYWKRGIREAYLICPKCGSKKTASLRPEDNASFVCPSCGFSHIDSQLQEKNRTGLSLCFWAPTILFSIAGWVTKFFTF